MIYRFTSKATGDILMLGPHGDALLRLLGREPAPRGIIEVASMPAAIAALRQAISDDEALRRQGGKAPPPDEEAAEGEEATDTVRERVPLRRRMWPMIQMLERALAEREPVVWGV
jgi:hypothetical protein